MDFKTRMHKIKTATISIRLVEKMDEFTAGNEPVSAEPSLNEMQDVVSLENIGY